MRLLLLLPVAIMAASSSVEIDKNRGEVRFAAVVQPKAMNRPLGVKGHHAIVWKGGRAHHWALFRSEASDHEVRVALDALGAQRGENLTPDGWNARHDPQNREPDKRVEGTRVDVFVEWPGSGGRRSLESLLAEKGRDRPLIDLRYGGNERHQKDFRSGCIVCLYSCPGGAIGNHAHPIRDYVRDGVVYSSLAKKLPRTGTRVTITLKPRLEEP